MLLLKVSKFFDSGYVVCDAISQFKQVGLALKPIVQIDEHGLPAVGAVRSGSWWSVVAIFCIGPAGLVVQLALEDDEHSFLSSHLCDESLGGFGLFGVVWPLFFHLAVGTFLWSGPGNGCQTGHHRTGDSSSDWWRFQVFVSGKRWWGCRCGLEGGMRPPAGGKIEPEGGLILGENGGKVG